jgi:hypothetical protein
MGKPWRNLRRPARWQSLSSNLTCVNAIYNPIFTAFSNHRYVIDYENVDPHLANAAPSPCAV